MDFYDHTENLNEMLNIINGVSNISLRIVDWFVTNFAKKYYTVYEISNESYDQKQRFKVYHDYKLQLKAYSKKNFDPFCRWDRIKIPYDETNYMETTIGQLNFFKWAIENKIVDYIKLNYHDIEADMNTRNSTSKRKTPNETPPVNANDMLAGGDGKTRKKREELSISACKCIKKESVKIVVKFN